MAIKRLYKCYIPSMNYVTAKGRTCSWIEGRYLTDHPDEIKELDEMCESKSSPHIYIDETEKEVDTGLQDRIKAAQQAATLAVLAEDAAAKAAAGSAQQASQDGAQTAQVTAPAGVVGMSPATLLGVTTSANLAQMAALSGK